MFSLCSKAIVNQREREKQLNEKQVSHKFNQLFGLIVDSILSIESNVKGNIHTIVSPLYRVSLKHDVFKSVLVTTVIKMYQIGGNKSC